MQYKKPTIGIMPKEFWEMKRLDELKKAINRYCDAYYEIPIKWIEEYNELANKYKDEL